MKLKDQGLEYVEVSDNGSGVEEENLKGMSMILEAYRKLRKHSQNLNFSCKVSYIKVTAV